MINHRIRGVLGRMRSRAVVVALLPVFSAVAAGQVTPSGITSISPNPLDVSNTPVQVTISGGYLASTCNPNISSTYLPPPPPVVIFGNTDVSSYVLPGASSTSISLSIPANLLAGYAGTTIQVTVTVYLSGEGCFKNSWSYPLPILPLVQPPVLTSINPTAATVCGPAFPLTLNGSKFVNPTLAVFGSDLNQGDFVTYNVTSFSPTQLNVNIALPSPSSFVPPVTSTITFYWWAGNLNTSTNTFTPSNALPFTIYPTPVLQKISPTTITAGSGAVQLQATISGYIAGGTTKVLFGGTPLAVVSETSQSGGIWLVALTLPASLIPTPAPGATQTVQVTVVNQDGANPSATPYPASCSAPQSVTVVNPAQLSITTQPPLSDGEVNVKYSQTFAATGGTSPYAWSMTPAVPGLTLDPKSAILSGTPTTQSSGSISVTATDANSKTVTSQFPLTIYAPVSVPSPVLPAGTVNTPYSQTLTTAGGKAPFTWSIPPGSTAPGGLALSSAGVLSWTPSAAGTYSFAVVVTDTLGGFAGPLLSLTIHPAATAPTITTTSLPPATYGNLYSQRVVATGGTAPLTYAATGLPSWLTLNASTGALSGTPDTPGTSNITFTVTDKASAQAKQAVTLTVNMPAPPSVTIKPSTDAQPTLSLNLGAGYPTDMMGTLTLSFSPNAAGVPNNYTPSDMLFGSGGTSLTAKIAATSTTLTLPANQAIQLGSVAGTVTVTLTALTAVLPNGQTSPLNVPTPAPSTTIPVPRSKPVITGTVTINRTASPPTVEITRAVSNPRDLASAMLTFHPASNATLNGASLPVQLNTGQPSTWWTSANGLAAGGAFDLVIPFNFQGDPNAIGTVDVTLTNSAGTSDSKSGN